MGRLFFKYIRPYWKAAVLAPLLMLVEVAADLMQPTLMARIIDSGISRGDTGLIIRTGLLMIGLTLVGIVGGIGCTVFSSIASQNFGTDLRGDLFKKVQGFSFSSLDKFRTASLVTRLTNDVVQLQTVVMILLRIMVRAPLLCIGGVVMSMIISPELSVVLIVAIPILALAFTYLIRKGSPLFVQVQKRLDAVNTVMQENLAGIRVVKAFVRADYEKKRFKAANDTLAEVTIKASRVIAANMPIMFMVMNLSIVAVLWLGSLKVNAGTVQVGKVIAFTNYILQILFSFMMVASMLMMSSRAKASADRVNEVFNTEPEFYAPGVSGSLKTVKKGRVDFENVSFTYEGARGKPVLQDITFTAMPGETIAILGATGSGKTTLVSLIPRFYDPTGGRVLVDGIDLRDYSLEALRGSIGMVLQQSILFSGTIIDNIRWGKEDASEEEVIEAARAACAHEFIVNLPDGYNTVLGQRGVNLSGGQKQRLAIARALLKRPPILILDDSTSSVDMATEARIQAALKEYLQGTTCFVIAQRISTVVDADRIIVLEDGRIAGMGTHDELMESCDVYRDIYFSQVGGEAV